MAGGIPSLLMARRFPLQIGCLRSTRLTKAKSSAMPLRRFSPKLTPHSAPPAMPSPNGPAHPLRNAPPYWKMSPNSCDATKPLCRRLRCWKRARTGRKLTRMWQKPSIFAISTPASCATWVVRNGRRLCPANRTCSIGGRAEPASSSLPGIFPLRFSLE